MIKKEQSSLSVSLNVNDMAKWMNYFEHPNEAALRFLRPQKNEVRKLCKDIT